MTMMVEKDFQSSSKLIIEDRYKGAYSNFVFMVFQVFHVKLVMVRDFGMVQKMDYTVKL